MSVVRDAAPLLFVLAKCNKKTFETLLKDKNLSELALKALVEIAHNIQLHKTLTKNRATTGRAGAAKKRVIVHLRKKFRPLLRMF